MNRLREALPEYLQLRRSLGFKLHDAGLLLPRFVAFLEEHHASHDRAGAGVGAAVGIGATCRVGAAAGLRSGLRPLSQRHRCLDGGSTPWALAPQVDQGQAVSVLGRGKCNGCWMPP